MKKKKNIKNKNVSKDNEVFKDTKKKDIKIVVIIVFMLVVLLSTIIILSIKCRSNNSDVVENNSKQNNNEQHIMTIKKEIIVEVGSELPKISDYYNNYEKQENEEIEYYFEDEKINLEDMVITDEKGSFLKEVKEYKVIINGKDESILKVVDTTKPEVKIRELTITEGEKYDIKSFVLEYRDNSNLEDFDINYEDESNSSISKEGTYDIVINICDKYNNCVEETTKLIVNSKKGSTSSSNSNNTSKNDKNTNENSIKTYVKDVKEKVIINSENKYGTIINTYVTITYKVYSDGSKEEASRTKETKEIDFSKFNGTVSQMKVEAQSIYSSLANTRTTILNKTNEYRREVGASELVLDEKLSMVATIKAIEMAYSNKFDHTRPGGKQWITLHEEYMGSSLYEYFTYAENIALNNTNDLGACEQWRKSEGHYKNMINSSFKKIGIGKYTLNGTSYYVQEFGG